MATTQACPAVETIASVFSWLDQIGYPALSRWPLFAARCWSPGLERRAWSRYRSGLCNLEEVAIPRLYWRALPAPLRPWFHALLRGEPLAGWSAPAELRDLFSPEETPRLRIIPRFGRYVLASPKAAGGDEHVYFGDDTLYLMQRGRELLRQLPSEGKMRVLDLCCGGGGVGLGLGAFDGTVLGVDTNPIAIQLATIAAQAQGLDNYSYHHGSVDEVSQERYDLVLGNPPSLMPDLGGTSTVYATGSAARWLLWLEQLERSLSQHGRLLLTVFSVADGAGPAARDPLYLHLAQQLRRDFRYTVRRQFPIASGRCLRHVALELLPQGETVARRFVPCAASLDLPALAWRRRRG